MTNMLSVYRAAYRQTRAKQHGAGPADKRMARVLARYAVNIILAEPMSLERILK